MTRIVDDDPPIKTHPASQAYRENYDRIFGEAPVYYAHPIWFYNTHDESVDLAEIVRQLGVALNPNALDHETGYQERKARTGNGMDYFYEEVLPGCRACVFRADRDGLISPGVAGEVAWFIERGLPVYEIVDGMLVPSGLDPARVMSREESRARCKQ